MCTQYDLLKDWLWHYIPQELLFYIFSILVILNIVRHKNKSFVAKLDGLRRIFIKIDVSKLRIKS